MRFERINQLEAEFERTGRDNQNIAHRLERSLLPINDELSLTGADNQLPLLDARRSDGDASYYYRENTAKDQIVLHYTAGYLPGDIATLSQSNNHVSVPFVIGRNGHCYNLFSSRFWSYHLGRNAHGGNRARSARSIGIELSNIGPLERRDDALYTIYGDVYCNLADTNQYRQQSYRGYDYFASFTNAQYDTLAKLLRYLCRRHSIERKFLAPAQRYQSLEGIGEFGGIVSHVNYRPRGKTDIGPAFDWDWLIDAIDADVAELTNAELQPA